jgi:hypothetical protein
MRFVSHRPQGRNKVVNQTWWKQSPWTWKCNISLASWSERVKSEDTSNGKSFYQLSYFLLWASVLVHYWGSNIITVAQQRSNRLTFTPTETVEPTEEKEDKDN